jgi:hypothetical protein
MNSASAEQFYEATSSLQDIAMTISLPPVDCQHGQEGRPYRCNVPILQELYSL